MLAKDGGMKMIKNYTIAVAGTGYKVRLYKSTLRL